MELCAYVVAAFLAVCCCLWWSPLVVLLFVVVTSCCCCCLWWSPSWLLLLLLLLLFPCQFRREKSGDRRGARGRGWDDPQQQGRPGHHAAIGEEGCRRHCTVHPFYATCRGVQSSGFVSCSPADETKVPTRRRVINARSLCFKRRWKCNVPFSSTSSSLEV